jgi:hypothetical protein
MVERGLIWFNFIRIRTKFIGCLLDHCFKTCLIGCQNLGGMLKRCIKERKFKNILLFQFKVLSYLNHFFYFLYVSNN